MLIKNMMASVAVLSMAALMVAAEAQAGESLSTGEPVDAFYVKDVTGPSAGKKLCYRCKYGDRPVVSIFTHSVDDNVGNLVKEVDAQVAKNESKKMAAFMVLLDDAPDAKESALKSFAQKHNVKNVPMTTFEGVAGPPTYKVNADAEVTVMMWVDGKLAVNQEYKASELNGQTVSKILQQTGKILN